MGVDVGDGIGAAVEDDVVDDVLADTIGDEDAGMHQGLLPGSHWLLYGALPPPPVESPTPPHWSA